MCPGVPLLLTKCHRGVHNRFQVLVPLLLLHLLPFHFRQRNAHLLDVFSTGHHLLNQCVSTSWELWEFSRNFGDQPGQLRLLMRHLARRILTSGLSSTFTCSARCVATVRAIRKPHHALLPSVDRYGILPL